ncbi:hypothetical protein O7635_15480 [Asanoa sp. WMMD1127]|uniref:hypothetical protein n=1 Tax=Asanoa sp. WMMD1127 TaxID=3016107 RepID=UPI00241602AD|nr:hypothetical protein [Asanoa sp. WMMD1127]MDG4823257.1 hypothetical protein [Asanoa sp. WMMD1127]
MIECSGLTRAPCNDHAVAGEGAVRPTRQGRQVGLQFHAAGPEAVAMVAGWAAELGLEAVLGRLFDDRLVPARHGDFEPALAALPNPDFVLLNRRPLQTGPGMNLSRLALANPGSLILLLGRLADEGLRESSLGAVADDPADFALWRRLISRARRSMRRGAVVTNPVTQASMVLPSHRYTDEALRLQSAGVIMLAVGGWNTYRLLSVAEAPYDTVPKVDLDEVREA